MKLVYFCACAISIVRSVVVKSLRTIWGIHFIQLGLDERRHICSMWTTLRPAVCHSEHRLQTQSRSCGIVWYLGTMRYLPYFKHRRTGKDRDDPNWGALSTSSCLPVSVWWALCCSLSFLSTSIKSTLVMQVSNLLGPSQPYLKFPDLSLWQTWTWTPAPLWMTITETPPLILASLEPLGPHLSVPHLTTELSSWS